MSYQTLLPVVTLFGTRETDKYVIDDFPFQLQYKVATMIAFLASVLVSCSELVGENIACHSNNKIESLGENLGTYVQRFCWITGLYVSPESYGASKEYPGEVTDTDGRQCTYAGDAKGGWVVSGTYPAEPCIKTIGYYQWIPFVLLLQGCLFYLPRVYWKVMEEGKLEAMLKGLEEAEKKTEKEEDKKKDKKETEKEEDKTKDKKETVANNVIAYLDLQQGGHRRYGVGFLISQIILVLNVLIVFWLNNSTLDGDFLWLGPRWATAPNGIVNITSSESYNHFNSDKMNKGEVLYRTFPRRAECKVKWYGQAGELEVTNYYCILGTNSLSQYIFLFLWFWYSILLIINVCNLIRITLMMLRVGMLRNAYLMRVVFSTKIEKELDSNTGSLAREIKRLNFGQFLFIYLVARNTDFDFVQVLIQKLKEKGAPDWAKTNAQLKKDATRPKKTLNGTESSFPLKNLPPSRESGHLPPYEDTNHQPQAPPLPTKDMFSESATNNTYPVLSNADVIQDYSSTPTMRKRNGDQ